MKYTISGFQQDVLVKLKLNNTDAAILRFLVDFLATEKMVHVVIDYRIYFWIKYEAVIKELPVLEIASTRVMARHFDKLVDAGVLYKKFENKPHECLKDGRAEIRKGSYTYFCFNPKLLTELQGGQQYSEEGYLKKDADYLTDDGCTKKYNPEQTTGVPKSTTVTDDGCTEEDNPPVLKSTYKDPFTIDPSTTSFLIVRGAFKDQRFLKFFKDFCDEDNEAYIQRTFHFINQHAENFESSLGDVIQSLKICCEKEKIGRIDYYAGILKKKAQAKAEKVQDAAKLKVFQVYDYLQERIGGVHMNLIKNYDLNYNERAIYYSVRDKEEQSVAHDILLCVSEDVKTKFDIELKPIYRL